MSDVEPMLASAAAEPSAAIVRDDAALYAAHAAELVRYATALVGAADADDVVADAVARAMAARAWPTVEHRRAYLYRAVTNEARRWHRRRSRRAEREDVAARRAPASLDADEPADPAVLAALRNLPVRQRAAIVLTYWGDLSPAEVAAHLGISDGAVKRHLARGRARLREVL